MGAGGGTVSTEPQERNERLQDAHEAEATILGAVLVDPASWDSAATLQPGDFSVPQHRLLWEAMAALVERGQRIDPVTVAHQLRRAGTLAGAGGPAYLAELVSGMPRVSALGEWVSLVRRSTALRRLRAIGERLAHEASAGEADPGDLVARVDAALLKLGLGLSDATAPRPLSAGARDAMAAIEHRAMHPHGLLGYSTGLWDLDAILQGIRPGRMGVIGARLGSGKSVLGLQVAAAIAEQEPGKVALLSSLEMDLAELAERRLASLAMVDPTRLHRAPADVREERLGKLAASVGRLPRNLLVIEDAWDMASLRAHARQVQAERGLSCLLVDYVGLMDAPGPAGAREWEKVSALSKALRRLAKELAVPVIVLAQLNREPEGGGKRRPPTMADLAGSDALGRDAHWAVLIDLEPPAKRGEDPQANRGLAEVYVRKNRGGRKGQTTLRFSGGVALFQALARDEEQGRVA